MKNKKDYFYFKQFAIKHTESAMKVGFDGILLGAWCDVLTDNKILDVGTGTGLIALMLAQKNQFATIFAIEPDLDSFLEAKYNFSKSLWASRFTILNKTLQDFCLLHESKFDHIVCNPPFFKNSKISKNENAAIARHTITLSHSDLLTNAKVLLRNSGKMSVILPKLEAEIFIDKAVKLNFNPVRKCDVYSKTKIERVLITLSLESSKNTISDSLAIYNEDGSYSDEYKSLVKDFYLNMG